MASYALDDLVDVRANKAHSWRAGTVTSAAAGPGGNCWEVTLDIPVTANDWSGATRKYGGTNTLTVVNIYKHADLPNMGEGELIRTQV